MTESDPFDLGDRYRVVQRVGAGVVAHAYKAATRDGWCRLYVRRDPRRTLESRVAPPYVPHPNLLQLVARNDVSGRQVFAYEWHRGHSLADRLARGERLAGREAVAVMTQWVAAVRRYHAFSGAHGRLLPEAARIDVEGWARLVPPTPFLGPLPDEALPYVAPEHRDDPSPVRPVGDVYALGALLFALRTGRTPPGDPRALAAATVRGLEEPLGELIRRWCAPDPSERPAASVAAAELVTAAEPLRSRAAEADWAARLVDEDDATGPPFPELVAIRDAWRRDPERPILPEATPTIPGPLEEPPPDPRPSAEPAEGGLFGSRTPLWVFMAMVGGLVLGAAMAVSALAVLAAATA